MSEKKGSGVVQTVRKTWDKVAYQKKAEDRVAQAADVPELEEFKKKRKKVAMPAGGLKPLSARADDLNIDAVVGKSVVHSTGADGATVSKIPFFCDVCDCQMKDSISWLDHINGRNQRATLGGVRAKLAAGKTSQGITPVKPVVQKQETSDERLQRMKREEEQKRKEQAESLEAFKAQRKEEKERAKREKEEAKKEQLAGLDPDLADFGLPMGFGK
ncbi:hypothetical protein PROFUN_06286 [Planoprotostelium fungivorum]|uniref:U1-type domain-containing protein n=1 Tax=Planoprotostelium fungivorum TaxID=1890364 RepID=A0A2P6NE84_9EUKA|nr:hypothetical protein PROFUN_06286 [Planoprotostelium fungivorum]